MFVARFDAVVAKSRLGMFPWLHKARPGEPLPINQNPNFQAKKQLMSEGSTSMLSKDNIVLRASRRHS